MEKLKIKTPISLLLGPRLKISIYVIGNMQLQWQNEKNQKNGLFRDFLRDVGPFFSSERSEDEKIGPTSRKKSRKRPFFRYFFSLCHWSCVEPMTYVILFHEPREHLNEIKKYTKVKGTNLGFQFIKMNDQNLQYIFH